MKVTTLSQVQEWLPRRGPNPHKYENGYVFGIVGSRSFPGAAVLSATAAAKIGAGGVRCLLPQSLWSILAVRVPEVMLKSALETDDGGIALEVVSEIPSLIERCQAGWIGCGVGRHPETLSFVREVLKQVPLPMVLDADALTAVDAPFISYHAQGKWILTPHEGEFKRLIGDTPLTPENRATILKKCAIDWNCVLLLKGFPALIAGPQGEIYENPTGSTAATTAGCGDVLTGICVGLLGQGLPPFQATVAGMYLSGMASDMYHQAFGGHTMTASDILSQISCVLGVVYSGSSHSKV